MKTNILCMAVVLSIIAAGLPGQEAGKVPVRDILDTEITQKKISNETYDAGQEFAEIEEELRSNRLGTDAELEEIRKMEQILTVLGKDDMRLVAGLLQKARSSAEFRAAVLHIIQASDMQTDILKRLQALLEQSSREQSFNSLLRVLENIIAKQTQLNIKALTAMKQFFGKPVDNLDEHQRKLLDLYTDDQKFLHGELIGFQKLMERSTGLPDSRGVNVRRAIETLKTRETINDMDTAAGGIQSNRAATAINKHKEISKELEELRDILTDAEKNALDELYKQIERIEQLIQRQKDNIERTKGLPEDYPPEETREAFREQKDIEQETREEQEKMEDPAAQQDLERAEEDMKEAAEEIEKKDADKAVEQQEEALQNLEQAKAKLEEQYKQMEEEMNVDQQDMMDQLMDNMEKLDNLIADEEELREDTEQAEDEAAMNDRAQDQEQLQDQTDDLQQELQDIGSEAQENLEQAEQDMQEAAQDLQNQQQEEGLQEQQEALEDLQNARQTLDQEIQEMEELMEQLQGQLEEIRGDQEQLMDQTNQAQNFEPLQQQQQNLQQALAELRQQMEQAQQQQTGEQMQQAENHMQQAAQRLQQQNAQAAHQQQMNALQQLAQLQQRLQQQRNRAQQTKPDNKTDDKRQAQRGSIKRGKTKDIIKTRGWNVGLPPKARAKLTQSIDTQFPERYARLLELYYKNLAQDKE